MTEPDFVPDRAQVAREAGIYARGHRAAVQQLLAMLNTGTLTPPVPDPYPAAVQYRHATNVEAEEGGAHAVAARVDVLTWQLGAAVKELRRREASLAAIEKLLDSAPAKCVLIADVRAAMRPRKKRARS